METSEHLFFACPFSTEVVTRVMQAMSVSTVVWSLTAWIQIFARARHMRSKVLQLRVAAPCSYVYKVWETCNKRFFRMSLSRMKLVVIAFFVCCIILGIVEELGRVELRLI